MDYFCSAVDTRRFLDGELHRVLDPQRPTDFHYAIDHDEKERRDEGELNGRRAEPAGRQGGRLSAQQFHQPWRYRHRVRIVVVAVSNEGTVYSIIEKG